jgi:hypothetical protein
VSWPDVTRTYGSARCLSCRRRFTKHAGNQKCCSQSCVDKRARTRKAAGRETMRATYPPPRRPRRPEGRPLHGPNAHPYLVATRALEQALQAVPSEERPERQRQAIQQLTKERGWRFADMIDFALRERAMERPQRHLGPTIA